MSTNDPPLAHPLYDYLADHDVPCPACGYNLRGLKGDACPECACILPLRLSLAGCEIDDQRLTALYLRHNDLICRGCKTNLRGLEDGVCPGCGRLYRVRLGHAPHRPRSPAAFWGCVGSIFAMLAILVLIALLSLRAAL